MNKTIKVPDDWCVVDGVTVKVDTIRKALEAAGYNVQIERQPPAWGSKWYDTREDRVVLVVKSTPTLVYWLDPNWDTPTPILYALDVFYRVFRPLDN